MDGASDDGVILCVGLTCVDLVCMCKTYPVEDSDQRVESHVWQRGGNASNNCTVLSMLGASCECLTTLARAPELGFIEEDLKTKGIKYHHSRFHDNCVTPLSTVIVNEQTGSRTILHANSSLPELSLDDFKRVNLAAGYRWIHFEGRPNTEGIKCMLEIIDQFNQTQDDPLRRITTSVELEKERTSDCRLETLMKSADYVFLSKEYAQKRGASEMKEAVQDTAQFCRNGATVICPWGDQGAAARSPDGTIYSCQAFPPERVVDTLGAGDTFIAATIMALSRAQPLNRAVEFGCRVAGTKCGMQGFEALKDWYAKFKC